MQGLHAVTVAGRLRVASMQVVHAGVDVMHHVRRTDALGAPEGQDMQDLHVLPAPRRAS
jgi:hypothetical protein